MSDGLPLRPTSHVRGGTDAEPNADAGRDPSNPLPLPAPCEAVGGGVRALCGREDSTIWRDGSTWAVTWAAPWAQACALVTAHAPGASSSPVTATYPAAAAAATAAAGRGVLLVGSVSLAAACSSSRARRREAASCLAAAYSLTSMAGTAREHACSVLPRCDGGCTPCT